MTIGDSLWARLREAGCGSIVDSLGMHFTAKTGVCQRLLSLAVQTIEAGHPLMVRGGSCKGMPAPG